MNEGLFTAYYDLPQWKKLTDNLTEGQCTSLSEIPEGERPFFAAALAHKTGRPVLLVSANELTAQKHAQGCAARTRFAVQPRRYEPRKHLAASERAGPPCAGQGECAVRKP